jgi:iron complex transport system ATP-binding protein
MKTTLLKLSDLRVGYKAGSQKEVCVAGPINAEMHSGQLICLLGPNGAGKSTLLRTVAGLQRSISGTIELDGQDLTSLRPSQLAIRLSLVLTDSVKSGNLNVYSLIALGRYPYSGWLGRLSAEDRKIIDQAIRSTDVVRFLDRSISQLSDGECQKVMLARALAQDTPLVILDEPTAHLDLPSRIELMRLLHKLTADTNKAILVATHELDLALQVADQIWLLQKDGSLQAGVPEDLVMTGSFEAAFDKDGVLFDKTTGTFNIHTGSETRLSLMGSGAEAFWTKRALVRSGFSILDDHSSTDCIEIKKTDSGTSWILSYSGSRMELRSIGELLKVLKAKKSETT